MIPATNTMDAHAQDFLANDELLLSILKALAQITSSLRAARILQFSDEFMYIVHRQGDDPYYEYDGCACARFCGE